MAISVQDRAADLVAHLGGTAVADLLGVDRSQPSRWRSGRTRPSPAMRARILDVDYVLARLLEIFPKDVAVDWLWGTNAHLGGRRPVDLIRLGATTEVIRAVDAEAGLAFA